MIKRLFFLFFFVTFLMVSDLFAQRTIRSAGGDAGMGRGGMESGAEKSEEMKKDSIIYTAKYIRYTNLKILKEGTQTRPIDTTVNNFQNYSPIYRYDKPTIGLGSAGISYRDMLFSPGKVIGFDAGFHSLDAYRLTQDSMKFFRARTPFTELYYVNGKTQEQTFKVIHTQNVKPNFNIGAMYNRLSAEGFYINQKADHLNAALFAWYESPNKRYNIVSDIIFNTLKAGENGSTTNDSLFRGDPIDKIAIPVRLKARGENRPTQTWRQTQFFFKQFYYLGRIDSLADTEAAAKILPTQRFSHALTYTKDRFKFYRNEEDILGAFPTLPSQAFTETNDSTKVSNLRNEFNYSFYLRGKALSFIKNELKLDLGIQNDIYRYEQLAYKENFTNTSLKANLAYRFSDKVILQADLNQIAQGKHAGDFLYEANSSFLLSKSVGRIILGAYIQNKSPEQMFERVNYQYHSWDKNFDRTKITNLSFLYENPKYKFTAKAEYFLINNHLYFNETSSAKQITPEQIGTGINLIKITLAKDFKFGRFNLNNYVVYQKTDFEDILRTPEIYSYNSFFYAAKFFKVLSTNIGFDVRFNTPFKAPAYAINVGQFYNDRAALEYSTYPVVDLFIRATLKRANLFLKYDYVNQGMLSNGYYTVRGYPMQDKLLKFGVSWKFYN